MRLGKLGITRWVAAALLAAVLGLTACTSGSLPHQVLPPSARSHDSRPNIVFVLTDDLASNLVQYMPHVRALEQAGASFSHYFVVDSLCCPSRAAIFTGLYPHDNGVYTNGDPGRSDGGYHAYNRFGDPAKSFAVALEAAGYRTGFMGKYLNGYAASDPPARGWDEWFGVHDGYPEYNYDVNENGTVHRYGIEPQDYLTTVLAGQATSFIQKSAWSGKPFALEVATYAPHTPSTPSPVDVSSFPTVKAPRDPAFNRAVTHAPPWLAALHPLTPDATRHIDAAFQRRVAAVQSVDRMIGQIERTVAAEHELNNTYFVFSSDNGYHMGEYRMRPGKQTAFDTDIRVPLVVAGPGVPAGTTINAMTSSIDLAPTFLQIAGTRPRASEDGVSLLNLLRGRPAPADWQRAVLIEHHGPVTSPADPDQQPVGAGKPPSYEAMRTPDFLYVEYVTGTLEYYDLTRDPYELHNIAGSLSQHRLATLHAELRALTDCSGAAQCQRAASPSKA